MYVARVQGAPTKPSTAAVSPTSSRRMLRASPTKGNMSRFQLVHHLEAFGVADGLIEDGALVVVDLEGNAEGGEGSEDVGEENDAIGLERAPGLKGDLGDQVGGLGALAEGGTSPRSRYSFM